MKKILALLLSVLLIFPMSVLAFNDIGESEHQEAIGTLAALEIIEGVNENEFKPVATITRAEAATIVVRALGLDETAAGAAEAIQFTDVPANHWGSGYINLAAQYGIIVGYGDDTFGPEDTLTYEQIVKMLVCALGYAPKAEAKGGYPTGYLVVAKEIKLTKGITNQTALREIVAQLTFNALTIPMMEQIGYGDDVSYEVNKSKNLLTILEVETFEGKFTEIVNAEKAKFGDLTVLTNGKSVVDYLNREATIYITRNKKDEPVLKYVAIDDAETIFVNGADATIEGTVFVYEDVNGDENEIDIADDCVVYINGVIDTFIAASNYDYEVVIEDDEIIAIYGSKYTYAVVDRYDSYRERIVLKDGTSINVDKEYLEDNDKIININMALSDLEENYILTIKESGNITDIIVSTETVEGKITSIRNDKYVINGKSYTTIPGVSLTLGTEAIFYLNNKGEIVHKEKIATTSNYAFIYQAREAVDEWVIRVLDKDGLNTYTLQDGKKVRFNGSLIPANEVYTNLVGTGVANKKFDYDDMSTLVQIKANSDDVITEITTDFDKVEKSGKYSKNSLALGNTWLSKDVIVFDIPKTATKVEEISVSNLNALNNGDTYSYIALGDEEVEVLVIVAGTASANLKAPIAIVIDESEIIDDEDNTLYEYTLLVDGKEIPATCETDDYDINDVILITYNADGHIDTTLTTEINIKDSIDDLGGRKYIYGKVSEIKNNSAKLEDGTMFVLEDGNGIYKFDKDEIVPATVLDLRESESDLDCYVFVVLDDEDNLLAMIIFEPVEKKLQ